MGREGAIDSHYFVPISCIDANLRTWGPATALTVRKKPLEGNTKGMYNGIQSAVCNKEHVGNSMMWKSEKDERETARLYNYKPSNRVKIVG
jgi:hypothetical protein